MVRLGVDLGGTKIEVVAIESSGVERYRRRVATPSDDYAGCIEQIARLVEDAEREAGRGTLGVATPGARSHATGRIKNANSTWLNGRTLKEDLEKRLAREVRLENDANCFALSEARDGAAHGARTVFGVILGTGVGGGIVVDGRVISGANAIAGEWGHNPLPLPSAVDQPLRACYCGRSGCVETYLSGPAFSAEHARECGERVEPTAIAERAQAGDSLALSAMHRYEERLARALGSIINVLDPDVIVLGGGLSKLASLYARVPELWRNSIFSDEVRTRLVPPRHGDSSGVRGAAWLWEDA